MRKYEREYIKVRAAGRMCAILGQEQIDGSMKIE